MTAKFEAFTDALEALCEEYGIHLRESHEYDDYSIYAEEASDSQPAGVMFRIMEVINPTPEEIAAENARRAAADAEWNAKWAAKWDGSYIKHHFELLDSMSLEEKQAMIAANAEEQRKKHMRVTRIPGDHNDIGERPCRVYCNEIEIEGWTVADDFRRVVETPGKVHHGAVRIDLAPLVLPEDVQGIPEGAEVQRIWADSALVYEAPAKTEKPNHNIPARKRKAGK